MNIVLKTQTPLSELIEIRVKVKWFIKISSFFYGKIIKWPSKSWSITEKNVNKEEEGKLDSTK